MRISDWSSDVCSSDLVVEALEADGHKVVKSQVVLDRPIKAIGMHEVKVALHPEVAVTIKINVARSPEEAEMQAEGVDVMAQMFEEAHDVAGFTEDYQASQDAAATLGEEDRKSTRLNSSH